MLLVQMHSRLREALRSDFPIVTLFQYPTIRSLAAHLGAPGSAEPTGRQLRERAQRQKEALAQMRTALRR